MLSRTFITLILALLPLAAWADDAAPADTPSPAPAATTAPADNTATSAGLGPDAVSPSAGGSNADSTALQPAGNAPIQSGATDSAGLTAPANALQAPAGSSDQLKVLSGEADGAPHQLDDAGVAPWGWIALGVFIALLGAAAVVWRDRRRFGRVEF